jgi:hypothetical protein
MLTTGPSAKAMKARFRASLAPEEEEGENPLRRFQGAEISATKLSAARPPSPFYG